MTISFEERSNRQLDLFPPDRVKNCTPIIIGVGAVGRQVALQLAAMGVPRMVLVDFDTVEAANLGPQGYCEADIGHKKIAATHGMCRAYNQDIDVTLIDDRFKKAHVRDMEDLVVFCCVDSITVRKDIWEMVQNQVRFWVDGRMTAEVLRIVAVTDATKDRYAPTLFTANEAFQGSCTAKSTIFCANLCAALMVGQFSKWLRSFPLDTDFQFNHLAMDLIVRPNSVAARA